MSAETMIGFVEKLESDAGIREEFETALGSTEDTGATVIEFASRHGFEVTEEDCRALATAAEGELDDDALEGVAWGAWPGFFVGVGAGVSGPVSRRPRRGYTPPITNAAGDFADKDPQLKATYRQPKRR